MYTEETAPPGLWKSELLFVLGLWFCATPFVVPPGYIPHNNWLIGMAAVNVAIMMAGNERWERLVATAAALWLVISGFVPPVLSGTALLINQIGVGVAIAVAAVAAEIHLRNDIRHARPLTM